MLYCTVIETKVKEANTSTTTHNHHSSKDEADVWTKNIIAINLKPGKILTRLLRLVSENHCLMHYTFNQTWGE